MKCCFIVLKIKLRRDRRRIWLVKGFINFVKTAVCVCDGEQKSILA